LWSSAAWIAGQLAANVVVGGGIEFVEVADDGICGSSVEAAGAVTP
jgi:hypothetical protein